ncbi:MAG TPA: DUF6790 family protein [Verrucomicrobiae bacterium]|nr:DUF6790 family protein [Verrucomicrobiae bacterium]
MSVVIGGILGNLYAVLFVVALVVWLVKMRRARAPLGWAYVLWGELLFYTVGVGFAYAGLMHAYAQSTVAPLIGWQPSPFEYELGWCEVGLAVVALMSLRRGSEFRLAATLAFAIFSFAAAAQHIAQMRCCANFAPGNAGGVLWFGDLFLPALLLVLAALARRGAQT